jgi:hypothetical protein
MKSVHFFEITFFFAKTNYMAIWIFVANYINVSFAEIHNKMFIHKQNIENN